MIDTKIAKVKLERGTETQRVLRKFKISELVYSIDKKRMFIGDGNQFGGILVSNRNYVINVNSYNFKLPDDCFYGDIINNKATDCTYIIGYASDGVTLSANLICDNGCLRQIRKKVNDLYEKLKPLTACADEQCEVLEPISTLKWITHPTSIYEASLASSCSFTSLAQATDPISYQWYKSNSPYVAIPGATNRVLVLNSIKDTDAATYVCVATTTKMGSITSNEAKLTIKKTNKLIDDTYELAGGYKASTYTFLYKTSAFIEPSTFITLQHILEDPNRIKTTNIPSIPPLTAQYLEGNCRINHSLGYVINSDGSISRSKTKYIIEYLEKIFDQVVDIFIPSWPNHAYFLLQNNDLMKLSGFTNLKDPNTKTQTPTLMLNNVSAFLAKDKSHGYNFVVSTKDDKVYGYGYYSGKYQFFDFGIKASDVIFCGASMNSFFIYATKTENNKVYDITSTTSTSVTFKGEVILDGIANEHHYIILTDKNVYIYPRYLLTAIPKIYPFTNGLKIEGYTSYSCVIKTKDNKYYRSINGDPPTLDAYFTSLKPYLDSIKYPTP